jgi:DNA-binding CsgD family transcriptional regulator
VNEGRLDRNAVAAVAAAAGMTATADPPAGLTERELEVLRLVARGLATKEVARRLGISVKTADFHLQRVYDKAGVRTRAGIALYAVEQGLLR